MFTGLDVRGAAFVEEEVKTSKAGVHFKARTESKGKDGNIYHNIFHVTASGKQSEWLGANLNHGDQVYIKGFLTNSKYTDRNGVDRTFMQVYAPMVQRLFKGDNQQSNQLQGNSNGAPMEETHQLDEIPF